MQLRASNHPLKRCTVRIVDGRAEDMHLVEDFARIVVTRLNFSLGQDIRQCIRVSAREALTSQQAVQNFSAEKTQSAPSRLLQDDADPMGGEYGRNWPRRVLFSTGIRSIKVIPCIP